MRRILSRWLLTVTVACCAPVLALPPAPDAATANAYIVQSRGTQSAVRIVKRVGGRITHDLPIIHGVSAMLTPAQAARLRQLGTVDLFADTTVMTQWTEGDSGSSGGALPNQDARTEIGADRLGAQGFDGSGITVAVLDTGLASSWQYLIQSTTGIRKPLVTYSADATQFGDYSGHGTHVTSIIVSPYLTPNGQPMGMAPGAKLVSGEGL